MSSTPLTLAADSPDTAAIDTRDTPTTPTPSEAIAVYLDPHELVIAENVRVSFDIADHPDEAASIRQFGVRNPILAERAPDGTMSVIDGQVRTLIARAVGRDLVPVWVTDAPTGTDDTERRITRTLDQINLNDRRIPLTDADRAAGVALMLDLGASATRVAQGLQRTRSEIRQTATVGRSATAKKLLDDSQYSLEQLTVIADYEHRGDTDAVRELLDAPRYQFDYRARRIAADRTETRDRLHASLTYAAYGFGVLSSEPDPRSEETVVVPATDLVTSNGDQVSDEHIYADPSRWAVFLAIEEGGELVEVDTGAIIDPDAVDWDTQDNPDAEAGAGLRHAETVVWRDRWVPSYYLLTDQLPDSGLQLAHTNSETGDEARATAAAVAAEREEARQHNRRVRALNIRGVAAKERREQFLASYLRRRTPPAQAAGFIAQHLARTLDPAVLQLVTKTLGVGGSREQLLTAIETAPTNRVWVIVLAIVLALHEAPIDKSFWRITSEPTARYLHLLAELGVTADFALVDVEHAAAGDIDYRDIDIDA